MTEKELPKLADATDVQLQSQEHRDLLDIIDKLRSQGISQYVDLPQIIVCGDQSAGKSSVLEAISGLSFPTKDNLCTRFATELILRRNSESAIHISIVPGADRSEQEKKALREFTSSISTDSPSLDEVVEKAKDAMGLSADSGRVFRTDVLRVELSGPKQPHLTMVDLPGLFESGNRDQSDDDAEMVRSLVMSYIESPRSIILAVVSAKSDFALQSVTKHARRLDPEGTRTLGLITKPDTLDEGSDSERAYVELAQNKDVKFRLGWHVLRNRAFSSRTATTSERDEMEAEFFANGAWKSVDPAHRGIVSLRSRLSHILRDQILGQLPSVLEDVKAGIADCKSRLGKLGSSRITSREQQRYLVQVSNSFHMHIKAAVGGTYDDAFFGSPKSDEEYWKRLRAVVQNTLATFSQDMEKRGHSVKIADDEKNGSGKKRGQGHAQGQGPDKNKAAGAVDGPKSMPRSQYADNVMTLITRSRGRELPGTYNPLIVDELFKEQSEPWEGLIHELTSQVLDDALVTTKLAINYATDEDTAANLLQEIIRPKLDDLKEVLDRKVAEILQPYKSRHPITYNQSLIEAAQKAQADRLARRTQRAFQDKFGSVTDPTRMVSVSLHELRSLMTGIAEEPDMDRTAAYGAIDWMEAYYQVARKRVVDDISTLAVEECLIQHLPNLLVPETVFGLDNSVIERICGESKESAAERGNAMAKLCVLETGHRDLSRLNHHPR